MNFYHKLEIFKQIVAVVEGQTVAAAEVQIVVVEQTAVAVEEQTVAAAEEQTVVAVVEQTVVEELAFAEPEQKVGSAEPESVEERGQIALLGMGRQVGECGTGVHVLELGRIAAFVETVVAAEAEEQTVVAGEWPAGDELAEDQSDHHHPHLWRILRGQSVPESAGTKVSEQAAVAEEQTAVVAEGQTAVVAGEQIAAVG